MLPRPRNQDPARPQRPCQQQHWPQSPQKSPGPGAFSANRRNSTGCTRQRHRRPEPQFQTRIFHLQGARTAKQQGHQTQHQGYNGQFPGKDRFWYRPSTGIVSHTPLASQNSSTSFSGTYQSTAGVARLVKILKKKTSRTAGPSAAARSIFPVAPYPWVVFSICARNSRLRMGRSV